LAAAGEGWDPTDIIKLASLFQMKDRAARVGVRGVATLLRNLLGATKAGVHVFGHSFGAKVMLSALCAQPTPQRSPESLLLLQPAISHLCFADIVPGRQGSGGYRKALKLVGSPIFTTFSSMDFPLHKIFHLALRRPADLGELRVAMAGEPPDRYAALGGYGPRRAGERAAIDPIPALGENYPNLAGVTIVGLDGSAQRITSHTDVANEYTAWALRTQIERT
jgi:pimeloyl-ACP methyl ester carboxylesterase